MESNSSDSNNSGTSNLFELIQNIQNKLSNENIPNENNTQGTNDLKNNYEKNVVNNSNSSTSGGNLDFSGLSSILGNLNLSGIFGNNNSNQKNSEPVSDSPNIDINTIMKMQKIMSSMNRSDPRKNLLLSLKPFLRKSRQDKINEYITILSVTSALGIFGNKGGD
ncbi:MAG: hypothetical protein N2749_06135 [Clostridia bacterium]|nr:hypothetical protein [Clostridia bacterium]